MILGLTFDLWICLDYLANSYYGGGDYDYTGDLDLNTQAQYNALTWNDGRAKPTWQEINDMMATAINESYQLGALQLDVNQCYLDTESKLAAKASNSALTSGLSGKANSSHSHVISDVTGLQTALDAKQAATVSASTPSRTLNSNFTPSSTKVVMCIYTISISCSATIAGGGQTGKVELRSDTSATPTTSRCHVANTNSVTLAIAVGVVNTQETTLTYLVPAGHNVRLVSNGTATISIVSQTEVTIG